MPINLNGAARQASARLAQAFAGDDPKAVEQGFVDLQLAITESVKQEYLDAVASNDRAILAQRGFRQLTTEETAYYQMIIDALASDNPKQAFADITTGGDNTIPTKMLPETILDEIFKNLTETHDLLALVNMTSTGYITTWLRNKHTRQLAKWGEIESDITQEITSAFEVVQVTQGKLSAFMLIHRDTLALGPVWLDGYMRTVITEALACGLEAGIATGKGIKGEPIGLDRDISEGVSVNQSTGYPRKEAIAVTGFSPAEYGPLVARLSKDERGHVKRTLDGLTLVCNLTDYLTKVMPATTVLNTEGRYVNNLFPVPTNVVTSEVIADGEALLILPNEYDLLVGGNRGIEFSDEVKFFEDKRAAKIVMYAFGKAYDNTSALLLDISALLPGYVNVSVAGEVSTIDADLDAGLTALAATGVTLGSTFAKGTTYYTGTTSTKASAISLTKADASATATIKVNGSTVTAGTSFEWAEGVNVVTVDVTRAAASRTYTVIVTYTPDATLQALSVGALTLSPSFDADVTSYTASTTNSTNTVTATAADADNATVKLYLGDTEQASTTITWAAGENALKVVVTNGGETKTYTVTVTKS